MGIWFDGYFGGNRRRMVRRSALIFGKPRLTTPYNADTTTGLAVLTFATDALSRARTDKANAR